jgi:hypothetical protein
MDVLRLVLDKRMVLEQELARRSGCFCDDPVVAVALLVHVVDAAAVDAAAHSTITILTTRLCGGLVARRR